MLFGAVLTLAGCAEVAPPANPDLYSIPGFFKGLWHGFIILFAVFGSLFFDITLYAFPNSGIGYNLGFLIGSCVWWHIVHAGWDEIDVKIYKRI